MIFSKNKHISRMSRGSFEIKFFKSINKYADLLTFRNCLCPITESNLSSHIESTTSARSRTHIEIVVEMDHSKLQIHWVCKPGQTGQRALRVAILSTARIFVFNWSMNWKVETPFTIYNNFLLRCCWLRYYYWFSCRHS